MRKESKRKGNQKRKKENKNKMQLTESQIKQMRMGRHRKKGKNDANNRECKKNRPYHFPTAVHIAFIHYSLRTTSRILEYLQKRRDDNSVSSGDMLDIDCLWCCYCFYTAHTLGVPRRVVVLL
jgi:hypothetical protein